jgi:uncharacterized membrane protein
MSRSERGLSADQRGRRGRRALRWEALREYAGGALWVMPSGAAILALIAGYTMSQVRVEPGSFLARFAFQGTGDDARTLLTEISGTVVTVIALVLGLTVVALQLSSTQFSPRLLRNFLRDRGTQLVLSVFIATFVYSAAGLFTVGLEEGARTEDYPRLAISGAIVLLFASLGMVVYFADHLVHSIQIDAITRQVERSTRRVVAKLPSSAISATTPRAPAWAVTLVSHRTGYVQTIHPELLLPVASRHDVTICLRARVGQHVIAGTTLAWVWAPTATDPVPDRQLFEDSVNADVRIGFERTLEQDVAFGIRQLIDIASKALSAAINDPYTAVQAIDHLSAVCADLAARPLGTSTVSDQAGRGVVITPGNTFADYLFFICGLVGRYGARDLTVLMALLRLLRACASMVPAGSDRLATLDEAAQRILDDAEREMARPLDLESFRDAVHSLQQRLRA